MPASVYFPCPVERVWQAVTGLMNTAWRSDLKRVEALDGTRFAEHTKSGTPQILRSRPVRPFVPGYLKRQQQGSQERGRFRADA